MIRKTLILKIVLIVAGIAAVIWGIAALLEYMSWKDVRFVLSEYTHSFKVYDPGYDAEEGTEEPSEITGRSGSGTIRLKTGRYYVIPEGNAVSSAAIEVEINDDTSEIQIDPYFSEEYLAKTFSGEIPAINAVIKGAYPDIIDGYVINSGTFYHFGDWYSTTLHNNNPAPREGIDVYGVILRKENGKWQIAASPKIIFAYKDHKNIPADVLDAANHTTNGL